VQSYSSKRSPNLFIVIIIEQTNEKIDVLPVSLEDSVDADLLSVLRETTRFFPSLSSSSSSSTFKKKGVDDDDRGEKILVFCNAGVSRSVAVVLAHVAWTRMKERETKSKGSGGGGEAAAAVAAEGDLGDVVVDGADFVERALREVREKYPRASPNEGFMEQLALWVNMGCRLVATDETYKLFKHSQLEKIRRERGCVDRGAVEEDPEKELKNDNGAAMGSISQYYSCRKCRRILATSKNVLEHEAGTGIDAFSWRQRRRGNDGGANRTLSSSSSCSSIFVSPITWMMLDQTEDNEPVIFQENSGKIHCPKCRSKIGAFAWSGERCNCGAFVAPSFHIQKAKLDAFAVRAHSK
jgi:dual specificity phosphatase 12